MSSFYFNSAHNLKLSAKTWKHPTSQNTNRHIIVTHGLGLNKLTMEPLIQSLLNNKKLNVSHITAVDLRSHGDSESGLLELYDWWSIGVDIVMLMRHIQKETNIEHEFYGIGHSMGSSILLLSQVIGSLFSKLWLYEPIVINPPYEIVIGSPKGKQASARKSKWSNEEEALSYFKSKKMFDGWTEDAFMGYFKGSLKPNDEGGLDLYPTTKFEASAFDGAYYSGLSSFIGDIKIPVKVCFGSNTDVPFNTIKGKIPNSSFEVLEGLSHFGPMQQTEFVAENITSFFNKNNSKL